MTSSSVPPLMKDKEPRNWADLPSELTSSILLRLGPIEILDKAQRVCTSWRRVSKDPSMWRKIDMHYDLGDFRIISYDLENMCRHAVDRSHGGLVEIDIWYFGTDNLLNYIANSSRNLKSLRLAKCSSITDGGVVEAVARLPLLEDLEISHSCAFSGKSIRLVGQFCPNLKTLKLNRIPIMDFLDKEPNNIAIAIGESMHGLRHLQLFGNGLTNSGLNSILGGCPDLEHLDLRMCLYINLVGDLKKRCSKRIRVFRRPNDSTFDFPFATSHFLLNHPNDFSCASPSDDYWY